MMLEKLKQLFPHLIEANEPYSDELLWFETDEKEMFGIQPTLISERELELLKLIATPIKMTERKNIGKWYAYIYENKEMTSVPKAVRFFYFFSNRPIEERELLTNTMEGVMNEPAFVWLSDQHGWIVEEEPNATAETEEIKQIIQTITADFFIDLSVFVGQMHQMGADTRDSILREIQLVEAIQPIIPKGQEMMTFSEMFVAFYLDSLSTNFFSNNVKELLTETEIRTTIKTFIEQNLNVSQTAKKLFMHRNSVQYRIDKFIEGTGIDIRQFKEAIAVYLYILHKERID